MSRAPRAPRLGRPPAADSAARRHDILTAARRRFAAHGYAGTTLSAVAKDAGITLGAIYHYFEDKTALYEAVFDASIDLLWSQIGDVAARSAPLGGRIRALVETVERVAAQVDDESRTLQTFLTTVPLDATRHPELGHLLAKRAEIQERQLRRIVAPAFDAGEMPAFTDLNVAVAAVQILFMGWGMENYYLQDPAGARAIRQAAQVLMGQLVKPALHVIGDQRPASGSG